ncbi:MAG: glycosyltransferase family 61 protein, partial [Alphaproteobacteria bacterium]|nr:glycosyltransferase family 61 protein [Alphaproteobacteria bacterium]
MRENLRQIEIKVWNGEKLRVDLIEDYDSNDNFSYYVLNNITVEVNKNEIIIYTDDNTLAKWYPYIKFKKKYNANSKEQKIIKEAFLIHASYKDVYYHWIYDILPQLKILESNSYSKIIMSPFTYNFQRDSLQLFCNIKNVYSENYTYNIDKLFLPFQTTRLLMPKNFVFDFLNQNMKFTKSDVKNKIYITRDKKFKRSILNEKELIQILQSRGYLIYSLEDISFSNQVDIFKNASVIISAHGSGLTNIVFCEPGTSILEIYGPGCGERCFARISNHAMLKYSAFEVNKISYQSSLHRLFYTFFPKLNRFDFKVDIK